jgi:hypothetical protein
VFLERILPGIRALREGHREMREGDHSYFRGLARRSSRACSQP